MSFPKLPFTFTAVLICLFVTTIAAADNPLPNPGFEEAVEHWSIADGASQVIADAARNGKLGLRAGQDSYLATGASVTSSWFPVKPAQQITLDFWARGKTKNIGVYFMFFGHDKRMVGKPAMCGIDQVDGQWHDYSLKTEAPDKAEYVAIWVHSWAGSSGATDLDDFVIGGFPSDVKPSDPPAPRAKAVVSEIDPKDVPHRKQPAIIILKLDDLKLFKDSVHPNWTRLTDYLAEKKIKGSIGIICQTLEQATPMYCEWIKQRHDSGQIEFWFHAWDHATHQVDGKTYNEFNMRTYEEQKERLEKSQNLANEKLGFFFETFGPPGGVFSASFDENTLKAMADDPHIHVMLYPQPMNDAGRKIQATGKLTILDRVWAVNLEGAVGVPDFQRFLHGYAANLDRQYFVLQGHAAQWSPERFEQFKQIVEFLIDRKDIFMTPTEFAAIKQKQDATATASESAQ